MTKQDYIGFRGVIVAQRREKASRYGNPKFTLTVFDVTNERYAILETATNASFAYELTDSEAHKATPYYFCINKHGKIHAVLHIGEPSSPEALAKFKNDYANALRDRITKILDGEA